MDPDPSSIFSLNIISDSNLLWGLIGIFVFLLSSALVSGAEIAFFSLTKQDLESPVLKSSRHYSIITSLLERPRKLLSTILIANSFFTIGIVVFFAYISNRIFTVSLSAEWRVAVVVVIATFVILFFGEILPRIYAGRRNIQFVVFAAMPIMVLDFLLSPVSLPMRRLSLYLDKKLTKQKTNFSVDQLSQALELTSSKDTSAEEQKILEGIVSFGNTDVKQIMSPRIDVFALDVEEEFSVVLSKIVSKGFSRIPVYEDNIDTIIGVLFVKDLLPHIDHDDFNWQSLLREPFFVPENKKLDNLLKEFQSMKNHLAIVVDEYGGTSGLVSLEDIIEEIVGDISDEFDDDNIIYSQIDDKNFLFEGKINLKDFYRIVPVDEDLFDTTKGEAETLAGFILEVSGNFPKKGQKINFANCIFTVESVDHKRVKQIKVTVV